MKKYLLPGLGLLLITWLARCGKQDDFQVENLNHNIIMILGHAGMGDLYKYPNNSLQAIEPVIGIGADGTELDVQITKDSVLILFHDITLDGRTKCSGFESPYYYNWSDIKDCYYNTLTGTIPVYTADNIFSKIPNLNDYYFSFDCKLTPEYAYDVAYRRQFLRAIRRLCDKYNMSKNVFIEGDLDFQLLARDLGMENKGFVIGSSIKEVSNHNIFGIGADLDIHPDSVKYAHQLGLRVMLWGIKTDEGNKVAIRLNPDIVQTDKPIPILMLFNRFNFEYNIP